MTVRLFKNAWLESLTYMPIYVYVPVWTSFIVILFIDCLPQSLGQLVCAYVVGFFVWTLTEYLAHRFLFHFKFSSEFGRKFVFLIHGNHHELPKDKLRNMMPLIVTIPIAALLWWTSRALAGKAGIAYFGGFLVGYVFYDLVHYACHQWGLTWSPFLRLKRHHLIHHYSVPDKNFAVSSTFWDSIFHTKSRRSS
ncbi:sterol desaturase family protein [Asaia sp. HN010]|uniref:sterol desaturase family protein n=1 Tax=Asaia sp. HN010 TaxID=3081233 RepID=UPI0030164AF1